MQQYSKSLEKKSSILVSKLLCHCHVGCRKYSKEALPLGHPFYNAVPMTF